MKRPPVCQVGCANGGPEHRYSLSEEPDAGHKAPRLSLNLLSQPHGWRGACAESGVDPTAGFPRATMVQGRCMRTQNFPFPPEITGRMAVSRTQRELYVADPPAGWPAQPLPGDGPVLDMLLEAALVGEDLVAEVAVFLLPIEQEPEEKAIDPAHKAWQEGAGGQGIGVVIIELSSRVSTGCVAGSGPSP